MITREVSIISTWCKRLSSYKMARVELDTYSAHLAHGMSGISRISNLDIYRSLMMRL